VRSRDEERKEPVPLVLREDIRVADASSLVEWYQRNIRQGPTSYTGRPARSLEFIEFGDHAWGVLLAVRSSPSAAQSLLRASPVPISRVQNRPLHTLTREERDGVSETIAALCQMKGFASALSTKIRHTSVRASPR